MTGRGFAYVVLGLSGFSIIASLTILPDFYPGNIIVLGIGVVLLASTLVGLQLSYWREGEAVNSRRVERTIRPLVVRKAPSELRNPQLRRVWENMEESRMFMALKENEERASELREEKKRLGLSHDEKILFMAEPSWLAYWPIAILSASSLAISASAVNPTVSFFCLALSLVGLLVLAVLKEQTRYYLTNFRVLVRQRRFMSGEVRWSSLSYSKIRMCSLEREFGRRILKLEGSEVSVCIRGLAETGLVAAADILSQNLPVTIQS
jgi:hypothetical protein